MADDFEPIDLSRFVSDITPPSEIDIDAALEAALGKSLKSLGPITISGLFLHGNQRMCGNCRDVFTVGPEGGIATATNERTGESLTLCPACYVALSGS